MFKCSNGYLICLVLQRSFLSLQTHFRIHLQLSVISLAEGRYIGTVNMLYTMYYTYTCNNSPGTKRDIEYKHTYDAMVSKTTKKILKNYLNLIQLWSKQFGLMKVFKKITNIMRSISLKLNINIILIYQIYKYIDLL